MNTKPNKYYMKEQSNVAEGKSVEQMDTHTEEMNLTVWLVRQCIAEGYRYIY